METPFWVERPPIWQPTSEEYFSSRAVGSSALGDFRKSRRMYEGRYVTGTIPQLESSDAMILGSLVDGMLTEPEELEREYVVTDASRRGTKAWMADEAAHPGRTLIKRDLWAKAEKMVDAVKSNRNARNVLLGPGLHQAAHKWTDNGVECRFRLDKIFLYDGYPAMADLKCWKDIGDSEAIGKYMANWGTHYQMALYERGFVDLWGMEPHVFLVVCHNVEPHEVAVYHISDDFLDLGRSRVASDLLELGQCLKENNFANTWETEIPTIEPPRWAK